MGQCLTKKDPQSQAIDQQQRKHEKEDKGIKKLLLLGPGGAGKSTIFKQLKVIHGGPQGISQQERRVFRDIVYYNVISEMKTLIAKSQDLLAKDPRKYAFFQLQPETEPSAEFVEYLRNDVNVNREVADHIKVLWNDPAIQAAFSDYRAKFQVQDNASYFFKEVHRIAENNYIPTVEDVWRARARTTGIVEQEFVMERNRFRIFDVGGQRSERKKWIHCFEGVHGVIFVAALSGYDQTLFEAHDTNRMHEALQLFEEICNSRWFIDTSIILFLNKKDIFGEKIRKVPLTQCFKDYTGPNTYEDGLAFITDKFKDKNKDVEKEIYVHPTCALDRNNIEHVFHDVQHAVLTKNLRDADLL